MPIDKIRLRSFKCFADSGDIPLAPLTIIFGRNNTGKSSILQSIMLLRQTLDSPEYGPRLDLRGPLYQAGSYADIVHQHKASQNVVMEFWTCEDRGPSTKIELEFSSDEPQPVRLARFRVGNGAAKALEIRRGRGRGGPYELVMDDESQGSEKDAWFRFPQNGFLPLIGPEPSRVGRPNQKHEEIRKFARVALQEFETQPESGARRWSVSTTTDAPLRVPGARLGDHRCRGSASCGWRLIEDCVRRGKQRGELFRSVNHWLKAVGHVRILPFRRISATVRIFEVRLRKYGLGTVGELRRCRLRHWSGIFCFCRGPPDAGKGHVHRSGTGDTPPSRRATWDGGFPRQPRKERQARHC